MENREERLRELESELSPRHLRFARRLAEGNVSVTAAYAEVYPDSSSGTWASGGSRLAGKRKVAEYIQLITGEAADTFIVNRTEVMQALWEMRTSYDGDPKAAGAVATALKTLLEHLTPKVSKVELTGRDGGPVKTDNTHGGLSPAMSRAIMVDTLGLSVEQADRLLGKADD